MAMADDFASQHGGGFADAVASMGVGIYSTGNNREQESQRRLVPTFVVAEEAYPELAADVTFSIAMAELRETEGQIAAARVEYGNAVCEYNTRIGSFPGSLPARMFRFSQQESL
jgi:hypothetical protein